MSDTEVPNVPVVEEKDEQEPVEAGADSADSAPVKKKRKQQVVFKPPGKQKTVAERIADYKLECKQQYECRKNGCKVGQKWNGIACERGSWGWHDGPNREKDRNNAVHRLKVI